MISFPPAAKLTDSLQKPLEEVLETRDAIEDWVEIEIQGNETERSTTPPKAVTPPTTITANKQRGIYFSGTIAAFDINPSCHGWELDGLPGSGLAVFTRDFKKFGEVKLRCYWSTSTVQLVYPMHMHPGYRVRHGDCIEQKFDSKGDLVAKPRLVVETFKRLNEYTFESLLKNARNWFGKGYV